MKQEKYISPRIYTEDTILRAIKDFSEVASLSYKDGILLIEGENEEEIEEIFNECMNYILSL